MKELEQSIEADIDPLSNLLNLRTDMFTYKTTHEQCTLIDSEDEESIASIVRGQFGIYPVSLDWSSPQVWKDVLSSRLDVAVNSNIEISRYFSDKYGKNSDLAISSGIVANLTPEITKIAMIQMEGYKGPRSWQSVDKESSRFLTYKINNILSSQSNVEFFAKNSTFSEGLLLIRDTLIKTGNPDVIQERHSRYVEECINANARGEIILNIPYESDYTHPVKKDSEKTMICEASTSLLIPLKKEAREMLNNITVHSREYLSKRKYAGKAEKLNLLVGESICGAGIEVLSAVSGEAFNFIKDKKLEYGFYLAINNFAKKEDYWIKSGKLMNFSQNEINLDLTPYFMMLYVPHENAHILFPQYDIFGEVPADVPAVIFSLKESEKVFNLNTNQMIRAIFTEYASEIIDSTSGKEL